MINFDDVTRENLKEYNPHWPQIPDLPYRSFITEVTEVPDLEKQAHYLI